MKWFRRKLKPDWATTGEERWVVVNRSQNVVREQLEREWIDFNSGAREWRVVKEAYVCGNHVVRQVVTRVHVL